MKSLFNKIFLKSDNLNHISNSIKDLTNNSQAKKIFEAVNSYNLDSEIRYVGGCIRKIINKEKIDDIDLATNLEPNELCSALKKNNINLCTVRAGNVIGGGDWTPSRIIPDYMLSYKKKPN